MQCPGCTQSVLEEDGGCRACGGIWLAEDLVRRQVRDHSDSELEFTGGTFSKRSCPVCSKQMQLPLIFDVAIDRCLEHGMWFDRTELVEVMNRSNNNEWRLYGTHSTAGAMWHRGHRGSPGYWNPIQVLIDVVSAWRGKK